MSSRFLAASAALAALLAGCDREARESRGRPLPETVPATETTTLFAGRPNALPPDPRARLYQGNAFHIGEGQRLYGWMNCVGCHFHGGGGIGPPLMDDEWIYGGSMEHIVQTIVLGRPNGMPSFRGKIPDEQIWQLAAYIRSMGRYIAKDVAPGRSDDIHAGPAENRLPPGDPIEGGEIPPSAEMPQ